MAFTQGTGPRGNVHTRVRHGHLELELDVPPDEQLMAWAHDPHKALAGSLVTLDGGGRTQEHIAFATGYCVHYHEVFRAGDHHTGAYRCLLRITAPTGFTLRTGAATGPYAAPAAGEHGQPVAASAAAVPPLPGTVSTCPPDVTARLEAQVHLACDTQKSKCTGENTCAEILTRIPVAMGCIAAREAIMIQCYGGGDDIHEKEVTKRKQALDKCRELYQKKCGPFPQPVPAPQPVPSRQHDTDPQPHKTNPAVPVGLAGAALLLYYFWKVIEGILIII